MARWVESPEQELICAVIALAVEDAQNIAAVRRGEKRWSWLNTFSWVRTERDIQRLVHKEAENLRRFVCDDVYMSLRWYLSMLDGTGDESVVYEQIADKIEEYLA